MAKTIIKTYDYSDVPTILDFAQDRESFIKALMGPFGCIAEDTKIITERGLLPIADITDPTHVLSWNEKNNQFQLSLSAGAFRKGTDYLYRVITQRGEFLSAGFHHVLCGDGKYRSVQNLQIGQSLLLCSQVPEQIFSSFSPLREKSNVRHYQGIKKDSWDDYAILTRRYDAPPHLPSGIVPIFVPLSNDVRTLTSPYADCVDVHADAQQEQILGHTHLDQSVCLQQTDDFSFPAEHRISICQDYVGLPPYEHNVGIDPQYLQYLSKSESHHKARLSSEYYHSYPSSISEWTIIAIERETVKKDFWDMQVLNTNNYITEDGTIHHNSGKSSGCAVEILKRGQEQVPDDQSIRRTRWAVVRNSYPQLRDTSIKTFHYWFPPERCGVWRSTDHDYRMKWSLPDKTELNCEVLFRALDRPDHVKNLLSLELTGAWINEAREIAKPIIDAIQGRVGRFPTIQDGGCTWAGIIMDTNPPDTDSWWYKLFEEIKPANVKLYKQPSGRSDKAENLKNLPRNYYQNLMTGKDGEFIKVYIDGEYGYVQEGKPVYPNFRDSIHVAKDDLKAIIGIPLILGWDFGLTPACVIGQLSPMGCLNILHEFISENMGIRTLARQVVKPYLLTHHRRWFEQGQVVSVGDWAGNARAETDEKTCFMELKDAGIPSIMARTNNIVARTQAVDVFLTRLVDGKAGFQLSPSCRMLRKGFNGAYRYKRMQIVGEDRFQNTPEKNIYSHVHDAIQYLALSADQDIQSAERNVRTKDQYTNIMQKSFVNFGGHI